MINVTFDIPIINDIIHEGNESFTLTIVRYFLPSRVSRGSPHMSTVTIVDTTGELIYIVADGIVMAYIIVCLHNVFTLPQFLL